MSHSPPSSQLWYWILNIDELTGVEWGKLTTQSSEGKKFNFKIFNKKCFFGFALSSLTLLQSPDGCPNNENF